MTYVDKIGPGFNFIDVEEIHLSQVKKIVLTGDVGCTGFSEDSKIIFDSILHLEADLFLVLGDLAFTGSEEEFREIITFCNARIRVPALAIPGNHDLPGYSKFFGLTTYIVMLERFIFAFLDNSTGYFSDRDIHFLETKLRKYGDKNFIIFMHVPPPTDIDRNHLLPSEWEKLRSVLDKHKERIKRIFCAHAHGYHDYFADGYPVTISAGGGAAMIHKLRIPEQKIHNAVVVTLHENSLSAEVKRI